MIARKNVSAPAPDPFAPVFQCQYCERMLDSWLAEAAHLRIMHPEQYLHMIIRWEQQQIRKQQYTELWETIMQTENLPFGQGRYSVWGIPTQERDDNRGLTSKQQDITTNELEIYRTDDEAEARQLVRESGFTYEGMFYATTRISDSLAAQNKENVISQSGVHPRSQPLGKDRYQ